MTHFLGAVIGMLVILILIALLTGLLVAVVRSILAASKIPVQVRRPQSLTTDLLAVPRAEFLEFLWGDIAMTPWNDVDAGPICKRITQWVNANEVSVKKGTTVA